MSDLGDTTRFEYQHSAEASSPWMRQPCLVEVAGEESGKIYCLSHPAYVVGRSPDCDLQLDADGVSRRHCQLTQTSKGYDIRDLRSRNGVFVNGFQIERHELKEGDKISLGPRAVFMYRIYDVSEALALGLLYEASSKDVLTGAQNRASFVEWLGSQLALGKQQSFDLAVIAISVDQADIFKRELDNVALDRQIIEVYSALARCKPEGTPLARVTSFDFVLAAGYTRVQEVADLCNCIRHTLSQLAHPLAFGPLTASLGLATSRESAVADPEKLLEAALRKVRLARFHGADTLVR